MNNELEWMWKKAVVAYFEISWNLPGGTEENHKILHDNLSPGHDLRQGHLKCQSGVLCT
jgi:hypothetical protein